MKKCVALFLSLALMTTLSGCGRKPASNENALTFKEGVYNATVNAHNGELSVEVKVSKDKIEEVKITDHKETLGVADVAIEMMPQKIVEGQTLAIDTMSGVTITSASILAATEAALTQAEADIKKLKAPKEVVKAEDLVLDCDVVIAGAGGAGLSAAVEAANAGAKVIVVEKNAMGGGSTARSGGKLLAAETDQQKAAGIEDTTEALGEYFIEVGDGHVNAEKLMTAANQSPIIIDWLEELGVVFSEELEPLHENLSPTRGHYTLGGGGKTDGKGGPITNSLTQKAKELGVEFYYETPASELIQDADKNVVGLVAQRKDGSKVTINAKSVILATGGYDKNNDLMDEYAPLSKGVMSTVPNGNVGDGLLMAKEAGAKIEAGGGAVTLHLDFVSGTNEPTGLYIDATGKRFMNENSFWFTRSGELLRNKITQMYYVTDAKGATDGIKKAVENKKAFMGGNAKELAASLGMDEATLTATLTRYNEMCANQVDEDFAKNPKYLASIEDGEIYAVPFTAVSSGSFGGPLTNEKAQVLKEDGSIIKGLYAAGEVANGDLFYQEYPGSGTSITTCLVFGRIAGVEAAKEALK